MTNRERKLSKYFRSLGFKEDTPVIEVEIEYDPIVEEPETKTRYVLTKYDDKTFPSGDTIRMYPIERVELTADELKQIYVNLPGNSEGITQSETELHKKIRKVFE